ncbi:MAG TPA: hypothetical protein VGR03_03760 [Candidatus Acidoferrum sp.]|nr:hypothetical protein [Candidatus Acidoferrum sp.]
MPTGKLDGVNSHSWRLKIRWANKHIENLKASLDAVESHPYPVTVKRDPKTRERVYYATKVPDISSEFALSAGDILHNLRSALDHLACGLVRANGGTITNSTEFPIIEYAPRTDRDKARLAGKIEGIRQEAKDYILSIQPYRQGNAASALGRLHKLNIRDKHRLLLTFATAMTKFNIGQHWRATRVGTGQGYIPDHWVMSMVPLLEEGQKLLVDPPNAKVNENPDVRLQIMVNEIGVCEGEPLIQVLKTSLYWVQGITADCERFL